MELTKRPAAAARTRLRLRHRVAGFGAVLAASAAVALGLGLATVPAGADTQTSGSASATVADVVVTGRAIHIEGTGWIVGTTPGNGSTIAVKLGDALDTEPASGPVTNPATGTSADLLNIWAAIEANADGSFSADITFPTPTNTNPALASPWAVGTSHSLFLLTGAMESGDTPRSMFLTFTIGDGLVTTATTATTGVVTASLSGGTFPAGEVLSVAQGGTPLLWTTGSGRSPVTSPTITTAADGSISARVVLAAGTAPAGTVSLTITGDQGTNKTVTFLAAPSVAFGGGTALGATGTLTLGNLKPGATLSSVKLGTATLATGLTANASGVATATYTIPSDISPISYDLVITQTAPEALSWKSTVTIYPDETPFGTDNFTITSTTADQGFYQGFYQSAYSAASNALFVTSSDRGSGTGGYIYKLDPTTLAILASYQTVDHDGFTRTGAFGIGVDDVHGNVWVSNTGSASVAVYKQSDLSLVKQFPANVISHPRDVVYDQATDRVFVSSASEGSSAAAAGYISVFNAATLEKITDVQTGTRDVFNPVSLVLGDGKIYSPSLGSNQVLVLDTVSLAPTFLTVPAINVGGRGASGIAYDPRTNRLFIASQNSSEVVIADAATGATITEVPTGRGALNVVYDPVYRVLYVANFGGTSVTVLDVDGNKVAVLPIATANHVSLDTEGNAYVVDKAAANRVWRIAPTGLVAPTDPPTTTPPATTAPATTAPAPSTSPVLTTSAPQLAATGARKSAALTAIGLAVIAVGAVMLVAAAPGRRRRTH